MKSYKNILFPALMMIVYISIWNIFEQPESWEQIYDGIGFSSYMIGYMEQFFLYSIYSFSIMGLKDRWFLFGGCYALIRKKTKSYVFFQLLKKIFLLFILLEMIKIVGNIFIVKSLGKYIEIKIEEDFLFQAFLFFEVIFFLALLQALWEWIFESKTALIVMWIYYLMSLFTGEICYINRWPSEILLFFIPNFGMGKRITQLTVDKEMILLWLIILIIVVMLTLKIVITKKDFWQE